MTDLLQPLRLAVGSHKKGTGKGCAMNVISWENGDTTITDMPPCADPMLARVVQGVNDVICTHRAGSDLLCPECSIKVLDLAHRTVGTNLLLHGWDPKDIRKVWVRLAIAEAESVVHLAKDRPLAEKRIAEAKAWVDGKTSAASDAYASAAAAAYAYAYASAAAAYAAAAAADAAARLRRAHEVIDRFEELTGVRASCPTPEVTERAVNRMLAGV